MNNDVARTTERAPGHSAGRRLPSGEPDAPAIGDWLHIEANGTVTVFTGKAEVGQNIRTSLAQAVAEELHVSVESIRLVMADTDLVPYDPGTFGSRTTPAMASRLRRVAAAARELLLDLAIQHWQVDRRELRVADGKILHPPTDRSIGFGELTRGRRLAQHYDEDVLATPSHEWSIAGRSVPKANGRAMVTGRHRFASDIVRPGMLVGKVLRPPAFGATLTALDALAAEALPGVIVVHEGNFVGVAAPDQLTATRALGAIRAEWSTPEHVSHRDLAEYLRTHPVEPQEAQPATMPTVIELGSLEAGRSAADRTFEATYTIAYIAHAPLEARAAVAEWDGDRLTVWTGTQRPFGVRTELATAFQKPEEQVRVIVPDTGAGYGGKHTGDAALEAARLARVAGRPVKVVWTREEEFTWAYFRPAGVIDVASAIRSDGTLVAWEFHNYNSGAAAIRTPYDVPHQRIVFHPVLSPLRQGSYRALSATANHFARETHLDEIARALESDPLDFRLKHLQDSRLRAVLEAAASRFGWGKIRPSPNRGVGIAGGTEKGSYVATCAEVEVDPPSGQVRVVRVVQAFECGAIVNPDGLRSQIEGCIIQGLGGALFEAIEFEDGRILTDRFSRYRVPRFADVPTIDVVLVDRKDLPSTGAGETPIVGIAPAVGNAIFDATGIRLRSLPLIPRGLPHR